MLDFSTVSLGLSDARTRIADMIRRGQFKVPTKGNEANFGFEGESGCVNRDTLRPVFVAARTRRAVSTRVACTPEVGDCVFENNPDPKLLLPGCMLQMLRDQTRDMGIVREALLDYNADLLCHGVFLTADAESVRQTESDVLPGYRQLATALGELHGDGGVRDIRVPWKNIDFDPRFEQLHIPNANMWWEITALSDQIHYEMAPARFGQWLNNLTAIAGPVLALFANSPYALGKLGAAVCRDGLFRSTIVPGKRRHLMPLLETWMDHDDPESYLKWLDWILADKRPALRAYEGDDTLLLLRKYLGTCWTPIRPVVSMEPTPHVRLEFRPLCRQPSPADSVCATAFIYGVAMYLQDKGTFAGDLVTPTEARHNMAVATQWGLDDSYQTEHRMRWGRKPVRVRDLLTTMLLWAERGLLIAGFERDEITQVLRPAVQVIRHDANNGARWTRSAVEALREAYGDDERAVATEVARLTVRNSWSGEGVSVVDWASV